jgi:hypothetical protein
MSPSTAKTETPRHLEVCNQVTGPEHCLPSVVDVDQVRRRCGEFVSVERGVGARDNRPGVRVDGRFAGEVAGVELGDGGVDVIGVENDDRRHPLVGIDLDDREHLDAERVGPLVTSRKSVMI